MFIFEKLRKPEHKFERMFEEAKQVIGIRNLSDEQQKIFLRVFKEEVEETESWGHIIDEADLKDEIIAILLAFDVANQNHNLEKLLNLLTGHNYDSFVTHFMELIFDRLIDKSIKYFNKMPDEDDSQGNDKTWYSTHLSSLIGHLLREFKDSTDLF